LAYFSAIVNASQDAIIGKTLEFIVTSWNGGAERLYGYTAEEAIGQSMDLIIPERLRARHWDGWNRVMETGVTRYGSEVLAVPALRKAREQTRSALAHLRQGQEVLRAARDSLLEAATLDDLNEDMEAELRRLLAQINEALNHRVIP
jgi:PAS domain S-box-containing protein